MFLPLMIKIKTENKNTLFRIWGEQKEMHSNKCGTEMTSQNLSAWSSTSALYLDTLFCNVSEIHSQIYTLFIHQSSLFCLTDEVPRRYSETIQIQY